MRMLLPAAWRLAIDVAVLGIAGGGAALRHPIAMLFLILDGGWSLAEGWLARAELARSAETRRRAMQSPMDPGTFAFVLAGKRWVVINFVYQAAILWIFARSAAVTPRAVPVMPMVGAAVYVAGAAIRAWAMAEMGSRFKSWAVIREPEGLARSGPYRVVRHPSYLGLLLMTIALPLIVNRLWTLLFSLVPLGMLAHRVIVEERLLASVYADEYREYAGRARAKLLPFIW